MVLAFGLLFKTLAAVSTSNTKENKMAKSKRAVMPSVPSLDPSNQVHERQPAAMVENTHKASGPHTRDAEGNNCRVLSTTDASHVQLNTPLESKFRDVQEQIAATEPHERMMELENAIRRHNAQARPLGGIGTK